MKRCSAYTVPQGYAELSQTRDRLKQDISSLCSLVTLQPAALVIRKHQALVKLDECKTALANLEKELLAQP